MIECAVNEQGLQVVLLHALKKAHHKFIEQPSRWEWVVGGPVFNRRMSGQGPNNKSAMKIIRALGPSHYVH